MSTRTKNQTFMHLAKAIRSDGSEYVAVTMTGLIVNPSDLLTAPNASHVLNFFTPVENRNRLVAKYCGLEPTVDGNGTTWADVTAWGREAEQFSLYLKNHPRSIITLVGEMRVEQVPGRADKPYNRIKITMTDFDHKVDMPPRPASRAIAAIEATDGLAG